MSHDPICARFAEDLSALLDGELAPAREAEVRAHLEGCAACRDRVGALRGVDEALRAAAPPAVPADLRARLRARIEEADGGTRAPDAPPRVAPVTPRRSRRWQRSSLGAALTAAAALALYLTLPRLPGPLPGLDELPAEELALVMELETIEDLEVIANLEVLELMVAMEEGAS